MNPAWGIDWGRFIDVDIRTYDGTPADNEKRLQFAYRIDTSVVTPLAGLPASVAPDPPPSLPQRNLRRAFRLGLPSGQQVACAMDLTPLEDKHILIGKGIDTADPDAKKIVAQRTGKDTGEGKCHDHDSEIGPGRRPHCGGSFPRPDVRRQ
jgi:hypothetical protein